MMFTTPAIASEPYTAEAPSFRTSIRSIAAVGMVFRSTEESAPVPPGTMRRPLRSTRVRELPRPRRLTRVEPSPPLLTEVLIALPCSGRLCRKSPIDTLPLAITCSRLITVTGAGVVRSLRRMRDPVTMIVSSAALLPVASGVAVVTGCPTAGVGTPVSAGGGVCPAGRLSCAAAIAETHSPESSAMVRAFVFKSIGKLLWCWSRILPTAGAEERGALRATPCCSRHAQQKKGNIERSAQVSYPRLAASVNSPPSCLGGAAERRGRCGTLVRGRRRRASPLPLSGLSGAPRHARRGRGGAPRETGSIEGPASSLTEGAGGA